MQHGYYRLEHTYYSKGGNKYHGPSGAFHLSAVQNYDANTRKGELVVAVNLPTERRALSAALLSHSNTITRKNGRMAERFILSHDAKMSKQHRVEATLAFVDKVTLGGELKAYAYHHDQDTPNPHCHVVTLDVGHDGKPHGHFGRSGTYRRDNSPVKGNVTEWFRKEWETAQNEVLERHGYDFRVDRRSNLERGLEAAQKHRGPERADMEMASTEVDLPHAQSEIVVDDMGKLTDMHTDLGSVDYSQEDYIRGALDLDRELKHVRATQERIKGLGDQAEQALADAEAYKAAAHQHDMKSYHHRDAALMAGDELEPLVHADGSYKGFKFKLFGRDIESPKHKRAHALDREREYHEHLRHEQEKLANQKPLAAQELADKAQAALDRAEACQRELEATRELYGDDQTLDECLVEFDHNIRLNLENVTPQDVVALFENGELHAPEAERALELMGAHDYIVIIHLRDREERRQEAEMDDLEY